MSDHAESPIGPPEFDVKPDLPPAAAPRRTARDGSAASRPGDPAAAPQSDGEPIFSTDPLA